MDQQLPIRQLLQDKYHWSGQQILDYLASPKSTKNKKLQQDLFRLEQGEPLAYVIGWVSFCNTHIDLSYKPLIPRPETEFLINKLIQITPPRCDFRILDLCAGSGCIGLALLKHLPNIQVDFADIDSNALKQINHNLKLNKTNPTRFQVIKSNLFQNLKNRYDLIIANPPYVDPDSSHDPSLQFEPSQALFAADKGLSVIKKILADFSPYLKQPGHLYLEFGQNQAEPILQYLHLKNIQTSLIKDQFGRNRFICLTQ